MILHCANPIVPAAYNVGRLGIVTVFCVQSAITLVD